VSVEFMMGNQGTYWTRVYIMALGTISIIVRLTMLKYDVIRSSAFC
jgi:hypothetical protein